MTHVWEVTYKTYPEPGQRHDKADVFIENGIRTPARGRPYYEFGRGKRRYNADDVVAINQLYGTGRGPVPADLIREHPTLNWVGWWGDRETDEGHTVEDIVQEIKDIQHAAKEDFES